MGEYWKFHRDQLTTGWCGFVSRGMDNEKSGIWLIIFVTVHFNMVAQVFTKVVVNIGELKVIFYFLLTLTDCRP